MPQVRKLSPIEKELRVLDHHATLKRLLDHLKPGEIRLEPDDGDQLRDLRKVLQDIQVLEVRLQALLAQLFLLFFMRRMASRNYRDGRRSRRTLLQHTFQVASLLLLGVLPTDLCFGSSGA
jgi:hypothetical protein